jgi:hypothetical protein
MDIEDVPVSAGLKIVRRGAEMDLDEEAIEWAEVQRLIQEREWGPILCLPPTDDDFFSGLQGGDAFDTHDYMRQYGGDFRKVRAAMTWSKREHRHALLMLEMILDRIPYRAKYAVLRLLKEGLIGPEHCMGEMARAAYWYGRVLAARATMERIEEARWRGGGR